jgi:nitroimidazol reductase NimA-like FMN-containing flavoprotein (pyridoxamine 5'-phosphate oxidase superfamily)
LKTTNTSNRTQVKRGRARAVNDIDIAKQIIDDSLLCHVAQIRNGHPIVTPTCHWRDGNKLFWHGHAKAFNVVGSEQEDVCINISQLDGLVLARSAFHHSVNYRSVSIFGRPNLVTDDEQKAQQLQNFVEKISPGRWSLLRPINQKELLITSVAWIPLDELSVKMRNEGVNDDEADLNWPVWAGVVPVKQTMQAGVVENNDTHAAPEPSNVFNYMPFGSD